MFYRLGWSAVLIRRPTDAHNEELIALERQRRQLEPLTVSSSTEAFPHQDLLIARSKLTPHNVLVDRPAQTPTISGLSRALTIPTLSRSLESLKFNQADEARSHTEVWTSIGVVKVGKWTWYEHT